MTSLYTITWTDALRADIATARASVSLTALSLLPPRRAKLDAFGLLWSALCAAAHRGIAVRVILPAPTLAHPATLRNRAACDTAIAAGIAVILRDSPALLHAKTALIDNAIAWVGSGNLTAAAAHHNHECWLRTLDAVAAAELGAFQTYLQNPTGATP